MKYFNGKQYVFRDGKWNAYYSKTNQYFPVLGNALTVKYKSTASPSAITSFETTNGLHLVGKNKLGFYDYTINTGIDIFTIGNTILQSSLVDIVKIQSEVESAGKSTDTPDEGSDCNQWWYHYYDFADAWAVTRGVSSIKVAIIDHGIDVGNPDLGMGTGTTGAFSNIFINSLENPANGIDDDNNGYIDDWRGWNFLDGNNNVLPNSFGYFHGTSVAGMVSAKNTTANYMVEGIAGGDNAEGVKIIPIKIFDQTGANPYSETYNAAKIDDAIIYAVDMGAKIINMSFWCDPAPDIDAALEYAYDHNVLVTVGAGNDHGGPVVYPANHIRALAISSFSNEWSSTDYELSDFSDKGPEVALAARGRGVCALNSFAYADPSDKLLVSGTSFSAPYVAGVAALMLSANPCLSRDQLVEIMEGTATKDGANFNFQTQAYEYYNYEWNADKPGHSQEFGYGRIEPNSCVKIADWMHSTVLDLYIKDTPDDFGLTDSAQNVYFNPDYVTWGDNSPDIWVRNSEDGLTNFENQDPEYTTGVPVHVYVRVRNKSCVASSSSEKLKLYWSKAAGWSSWPSKWNGSNPTEGNIIGTKTIPVLQPGEETILEFDWSLAEPIINNGWHSCLLARIVSPVDPITEVPGRLDWLVARNNNVALKNVTIVNLIPGKPHLVLEGVTYPFGGFMNLNNTYTGSRRYTFSFTVPDVAHHPDITKAAEVSVWFDDLGWSIMLASGQLNQDGIRRIRDKQIVITKPDVQLTNIQLPGNAQLPVYVGFSFLTDSITNDSQYIYTVTQAFADTPQHKLGCEMFEVKKYSRDPFQADAGADKSIMLSESTTLSAAQLSELATYNWYDEDNNLVYTGTSLSVSPEVSHKYKLEVIASSDGFKDYDDVEVKVKKGSIGSLYPNPTSSTFTLDYSLENITSAYIMVVQPYSTISNNYILNISQTSNTVNMSTYPTGIYNVILVCDGAITDVKTLEKQ